MYNYYSVVSEEYCVIYLHLCDCTIFVLGRGGVRNESRAAKVALMKMKMKATGDGSIPQVCLVKSIQSHF